LIVDVNSVLGLVCHVVVGDIADILEVYVISIFRVGEFLCIYSIVLKIARGSGGKGDVGAMPMPLGTVNWESCADGLLRVKECIKNSLAMDVLKRSPIAMLTKQNIT
jgi:hypothetical protein